MRLLLILALIGYVSAQSPCCRHLAQNIYVYADDYRCPWGYVLMHPSEPIMGPIFAIPPPEMNMPGMNMPGVGSTPIPPFIEENQPCTPGNDNCAPGLTCVSWLTGAPPTCVHPSNLGSFIPPIEQGQPCTPGVSQCIGTLTCASWNQGAAPTCGGSGVGAPVPTQPVVEPCIPCPFGQICDRWNPPSPSATCRWPGVGAAPGAGPEGSPCTKCSPGLTCDRWNPPSTSTTCGRPGVGAPDEGPVPAVLRAGDRCTQGVSVCPIGFPCGSRSRDVPTTCSVPIVPQQACEPSVSVCTSGYTCIGGDGFLPICTTTTTPRFCMPQAQTAAQMCMPGLVCAPRTIGGILRCSPPVPGITNIGEQCAGARCNMAVNSICQGPAKGGPDVCTLFVNNEGFPCDDVLVVCSWPNRCDKTTALPTCRRNTTLLPPDALCITRRDDCVAGYACEFTQVGGVPVGPSTCQYVPPIGTPPTLPQVGARCTTSHDCDVNLVCKAGVCVVASPTTCTLDTDCQRIDSTQICFGGVCQRPSVCQSATDCATGSMCSSGICRPASSGLPVNGICVQTTQSDCDQSTCMRGLCCDYNSFTQTTICTNRGGVGSAPPPSTVRSGQRCSSNRECQSQSCVRQVCVGISKLGDHIDVNGIILVPDNQTCEPIDVKTAPAIHHVCASGRHRCVSPGIESRNTICCPAHQPVVRLPNPRSPNGYTDYCLPFKRGNSCVADSNCQSMMCRQGVCM